MQAPTPRPRHYTSPLTRGRELKSVKDTGQSLNIIAAPLHFISVNAPLAILLPLAALSVMRVRTGERFINGFLLSARP